jgi:hypothetical protein
MPSIQEVRDWPGRTLIDRSGDRVGKIQEIYLDADTDEPEWALVNTGLFGLKSTFVPIGDARVIDDQVSVPFEKSLIKDAPGVEPDGELSESEEGELYTHYGYEQSQPGAGEPSGAPAGVFDAEAPAGGAGERRPVYPEPGDVGRYRDERGAEGTGLADVGLAGAAGAGGGEPPYRGEGADAAGVREPVGGGLDSGGAEPPYRGAGAGGVDSGGAEPPYRGRDDTAGLADEGRTRAPYRGDERVGEDVAASSLFEDGGAEPRYQGGIHETGPYDDQRMGRDTPSDDLATARSEPVVGGPVAGVAPGVADAGGPVARDTEAPAPTGPADVDRPTEADGRPAGAGPGGGGFGETPGLSVVPGPPSRGTIDEAEPGLARSGRDADLRDTDLRDADLRDAGLERDEAAGRGDRFTDRRGLGDRDDVGADAGRGPTPVAAVPTAPVYSDSPAGPGDPGPGPVPAAQPGGAGAGAEAPRRRRLRRYVVTEYVDEGDDRVVVERELLPEDRDDRSGGSALGEPRG